MKKLRTISDLKAVKKGSVLTIGNFDGVHVGHQEIIRVARELADERQTDVVLMTFEPHPLAVLHPENAPPILTPISLKKQLLIELGVDVRLLLDANAQTLSLAPEQFVRKFVCEPLQPSALVEGEDFNFGAARAGNVQLLAEMGQQNGFEVVVIPAKKIEIPDGQTIRISSTMVRYMLGSRKVADAAMALGRAYRLIGPICSGRGIGKKLGFPTLNMTKPDQLVPAEGVYAGYVQLGRTEDDVASPGNRIRAIFSIGQARTFGDEHPLLIEAHLLVNGDADLAGQWMAMDFAEFIRPQHKFTSPEELSKQITKDCRKAIDILG
jgi:riboflavin kinase/FMN adenylyltransferase